MFMHSVSVQCSSVVLCCVGKLWLAKFMFSLLPLAECTKSVEARDLFTKINSHLASYCVIITFICVSLCVRIFRVEVDIRRQ
jgi:hypothetical protein